jgi:toxin ParE1/3/4
VKPLAFTDRAQEDFIEIWNYHAQFGARTRDRVIGELRRKTELISQLPFMGRPRIDLGPDLRSVISGSYLILYRVEPDKVEIVRYLHMRRELKDLV